MEDFQFHRRGAAALLPGRVAAGERAKLAACYDDVFGGPPRSSLAPARREDYREIFGAAAACSIPVLDLPPPPGDGYELRQCSALDYLDIFGGLGGGDFAASYPELFASQDSNGIGAPLPSELGNAAPVISTSSSRGVMAMGCEKQEMPASGVINEVPGRRQGGCSLNGVAHHLNDDRNLMNGSNHVARWSSKNDPVNGTIHKNQVHATPGYAFVVKSTEVDRPHTQRDIDILFDSNCSNGISEQHVRKTMLSTSCGDVNYSVNNVKDDQRSAPLEISGSMGTSSHKGNPLCSSEHQSAVPRPNSFSAKVSSNQSLNENLMEKKRERNCQNKTVLTCADVRSGNDLNFQCPPSEDVPANEEHILSSFNGHSASNGTKAPPDHLTDDNSIDAVNTRIAEANHFKKYMSGSPAFTSSLSSEEKMAAEKKSDSLSNLPKNATVNERLHSRSSSSNSVSSLDHSCPGGTFVTVSDINLRTQPSHGPPPARPPPARPPLKSDLRGRDLRRTLTDYQKHEVRTGIAYKSYSFKQAVRDGSPPPFDVEVDASSAAAASVAAIKEAMELAQAKLRSAKVSMERKKENLQSRKKLGLNEDLRSINRDEGETVQENQRIREEVPVQLACEQTNTQKNVFVAEKEPGLSNLSTKKEEKVGEWKVEGKFYEFVQSEKKLSKVPENSLKEGSEKRLNTGVDIVGEPNASEFRKSGKLLAASKIVEWEGDNDKPQNPSVTSKEQIKCSQGAALESYLLGDHNLKHKEAVNAQHQEKKSEEFRELLETEPETKWRTSEEAFICELNEKNLRVNSDAFKCKPVYGYQGQEMIQRGSDETSGCEETEKEISVMEKCLEGQEEERDSIAWGKLSDLDENKLKAKVTHASHVSAKDICITTISKNHEDENLKVSLKTDEYDCFPEGQEIELKEAWLLFVQDEQRLSNLTHQAFEKAENEDALKAPLKVHDWKKNGENLNVVQATNGCIFVANKFKDAQKFPIETEEALQLKAVQQHASYMAGIEDDFGNNIAAAQEDCKKKINENIKEVQVVGSNKVLKSAPDCKGTGNDKKIGNARGAVSVGDQWHVCTAPQESSGNWDAGWLSENDTDDQEIGDVNREKMGSVHARSLKKEKEREVRKIEEREWQSIKLEEESEKRRIELEVEKEREKKLEEAKERERRKLKEEKERERKLEEEKEKEKIRLEEERERERIRVEERERERIRLEEEERGRIRLEEEERERERVRLEEERERERVRLEEEKREREKKLEEERERKKLEDEEREKKKIEEERERKRLEEERERKKLEEEEWEKKKIEEERERKRLEEERERRTLEEAEEKRKLEEEKKRKLEEERERRKVEEEERRQIEEKERMRKRQEEEDRERSKLEEKERERRKQEQERERRRLEEIERERRKLEEKVRERRRIEEEERERKLEEEKARERQKIEEEKVREKKLDEEREKEWRKREDEKERERKKLEEEREREREREKDRQAVERATREANERAFAEARERAERAAVERITVEARLRALAEARERVEKASAEALEKSMAEKASREARLRSERAAVERATSEARERAVEKAIAEKAAQDARERAEKLATISREGVKQNVNSSNLRDIEPQFQNVGPSSSYQRHSDSLHHVPFTNEKAEGESAIRYKARMERHQRTVERAAKALAEKNLRDIIAQREQAERNRFAETLDADVKRWSNGKEGNLRALLSTLQYILGSESGWQPIPLTDVVTAPAVKKAYRKATLCVHPDKLQQRGASIQQKYICEKVFDLLKEAWNKFNSEER